MPRTATGLRRDERCRVPLRARRARPVDKALLTILIMLLMLGLLTLFSATYYKAQDGGDPLSEVKKQLFGVAIGAVALFFTSRIPYRFWGQRRAWRRHGAFSPLGGGFSGRFGPLRCC